MWIWIQISHTCGSGSGAGVYKPSGAPGKFGNPALLSRVTLAKPEIWRVSRFSPALSGYVDGVRIGLVRLAWSHKASGLTISGIRLRQPSNADKCAHVSPAASLRAMCRVDNRKKSALRGLEKLLEFRLCQQCLGQGLGCALCCAQLPACLQPCTAQATNIHTLTTCLSLKPAQ